MKFTGRKTREKETRGENIYCSKPNSLIRDLKKNGIEHEGREVYRWESLVSTKKIQPGMLVCVISPSSSNIGVLNKSILNKYTPKLVNILNRNL